VTDPLGPYLPSSVLAVPGGTVSSCNITVTQTLNPATYNCPLTVQGGVTATLTPGIYKLEKGITVNAGGHLTYAGPVGEGVLLYLPCRPLVLPNGCKEAATFNSGASVTLPPLNLSQTTPNTTALQGMWFWQAATNGSTAKLIGNGHFGQVGGVSGIAYAPSAFIDLQNSAGLDATGRIVAGSVIMLPTVSASFTVTGQ
jgi:hypothetical protein